MKKKSAIIAVLLVIVAAYWFISATLEYDIDRVDTRLRALQQPYQSVIAGYYLDGGSIGIGIVDRDGHREAFALPCDDLGATNSYDRVFVGAAHANWAGATEIAEAEHTKRMLVCILRDYPNRTSWDDYCLMKLRGHPVDFARDLIHKWKGDYNP